MIAIITPKILNIAYCYVLRWASCWPPAVTFWAATTSASSRPTPCCTWTATSPWSSPRSRTSHKREMKYSGAFPWYTLCNCCKIIQKSISHKCKCHSADLSTGPYLNDNSEQHNSHKIPRMCHSHRSFIMLSFLYHPFFQDSLACF